MRLVIQKQHRLGAVVLVDMLEMVEQVVLLVLVGVMLVVVLMVLQTLVQEAEAVVVRFIHQFIMLTAVVEAE